MEQGNQYHDRKGHFTDKENDGKECNHFFNESNIDKIIELKKEINSLCNQRAAEYKIQDKKRN